MQDDPDFPDGDELDESLSNEPQSDPKDVPADEGNARPKDNS